MTTTSSPTAPTTDVETLADVLDDAARLRTACARTSDTAPLDLATAYEVQRLVVGRRRGRGARHLGAKLGFTSRAKALQMGVDDIIIGRLTTDMLVGEGSEIDLADYVHPRVEPEVAFRLGRDLAPDAPTALAADAVDAVAPAMEIIDSRYRDFRFDLGDVVADNTSAGGVVVGPWRPPEPDLDLRGVTLSVDDRVVASGSTAAVLGDPWRAISTAARLAARWGIELHRGDLLLAGAATPAVTLTAGTAVRTTISGLGRVRFTVRHAAGSGAAA